MSDNLGRHFANWRSFRDAPDTPTPETLRELVDRLCLMPEDRGFFNAAADAWQLLIDAVNESDEPCLPECDSIAHAEGCPHIDRAAWMAKQQATIVDLRKRLEAFDALLAKGHEMDESRTWFWDDDLIATKPAAIAGEERP